MTNGGLLSRDAILGAKDINYTEVSVPEWGGTVRIKSLSGTERATFEAKMLTIRHQIRVGGRKGGDEDAGVSIEMHEYQARVTLCALVICDEHGNRLFDDKDVDALGKKSAAALRRVYDKATAHNGMTAEAQEEIAGESEGAAAPE